MTKRFPRSRGLAELERLGLTHAAIAKRAGVKRTQITMVMTRSRKPAKALRAVMHDKWKIDPAWWDEEAVAATLTPLDEKTLPLTAADAHARARKLAMRLLAEAEDETLPPEERSKRLGIALKAIKSVDEMTGESGTISISKILMHPAWTRIKETILALFGREDLSRLEDALSQLEQNES